MSSFVCGGLLFVIITYLSIIYESTSMALLGMTEAVLLVLSFFYLTAPRKRVRAELHVPIAIAQKDARFHVQIVMHCPVRLGYSKVRFLVEYKNSMEKASKTIWLSAERIPFGESRYEFDLKICEAGNYIFTIKKIRFYDLLGLFFGNVRSVSSANAMVLPEISEIPVRIGERVINFFGDADVFDELRPGYDPSETLTVREFRDGDKLPSVHWKLSAKMDELIVKENSLPKACPVTIFLNSNANATQKMLKAAVSLSFSLMDVGCPHYCVWMSDSSKDLVRTRVDDEESFYRFVVVYLQDCATDKMPDMRERYSEKYRQERGLHEFLLEDGYVFFNGERLENIGELELILN